MSQYRCLGDSSLTIKWSRAQRLFCNHGSEFCSQVLDRWAYRNGVKIDFSRTGKPTDNGHVESFNGTFRIKCLNTHWFKTLGEARERIEA